MSCPAFERLAAAASGEDDAVLAHLDDCADCQQLVAEQGALRLLASQAPAPPLAAAHRERLAAEVLARADWMPLRSRRIAPLVGIGGAAAAALALALGLGVLRAAPAEGTAPALALDVPREPLASADDRHPARDDAAPPGPPDRAVAEVPRTPARATLAGDAEFTRTLRGDRELVKVAAGDLTVDARQARPVHVVAGDTAVDVRHAKVRVIVTRGAIAQVSVFAGTAEVSVAGKTRVIDAGVVWERPATPADSSAAFQEGWAAKRAGNYADARAAFDRAVDPVVAPEALYWGAIMSERLEDAEGAQERYRRLVDTYPATPFAKKATHALRRIAGELEPE